MRAPKLTFEKIFRPALAMVLIVIYWATYPHTMAETEAAGATVISHYESACYYQARTERNIPALSYRSNTGLIGWTKQHLNGSTPDATLANYWAALRTCDATAPVAKFNWDGMYLAGMETIG